MFMMHLRRAPALTRAFFSSARLSQPKTGWTLGDQPPAPAPVLAQAATYNYDHRTFEQAAFRVAVAFTPKKRENVFRRGPPLPQLALGEDNLFVTVQKHGVALGVADGVGGWAEAGYDSLAISRELCHEMKLAFEAGGENPAELLRKAFAAVAESPKVEIGGTTACLGVLQHDRLTVANLGDSWCGLFRNHRLVSETRFQTHNFNTPYQLAKIPPQVLKEAQLQGKRYIVDTPDMADSYTWAVEKGDIVIFATDGVTDNVIPQDIETFLQDHSHVPLHEQATKLVAEVVKVSKDPNYPSAFAQELSGLTGQKYLGGKEDDVTLVMLQIK